MLTKGIYSSATQERSDTPSEGTEVQGMGTAILVYPASCGEGSPSWNRSRPSHLVHITHANHFTVAPR